MSLIFGYILLALGFGFVIFWHELGHFLAAKWAGVKVEQFAVGFGTAAVAWRKGLGFRLRGTRTEYERRCREYLLAHEAGKDTTLEPADSTTEDQRIDTAGRALGLGETEYRLNWLPLGGYVKMLGQDDLNPNAISTDPRAYNSQTIAKRMVIVSAGVIMNIILAAMLFFALFLIGFDVPPAVVGTVYPGSPAQAAGVQVGDRILSLDGEPQLDFTKIVLSVALLDETRPAPIEVERPDENGKLVRQTLTIRAARADSDTRGILALGVGPAKELQGLDPKKLRDYKYDPEIHPLAFAQVKPGETIVAIEGQPVADDKGDEPDNQKAVKRNYYVLDRALQRSQGQPFAISVKSTDGQVRTEMVQPEFLRPFDDAGLQFFGMSPRTSVGYLTDDSLAKGKLVPGDVITSVQVLGPNDSVDDPSDAVLRSTLDSAGQEGHEVVLTVLRNGTTVKLEPIVPNLKVPSKKKGIGVGLELDAANPVIAAVEKDSAADRAGVPRGSTIVSIAGQPVNSWYDVRRIGATISPDKPMTLVVRPPGSTDSKSFDLKPSESEIARINSYRYDNPLLLRERIDPRQTSNPLEAASWGVRETRDLIVQFYLTLKRMVQRSIPLNNAMGPVGIVQAGARLADRGNDWLIWFLAQISANLAVVNFLPIPIVDGGLFLFLIIEKLQGKPLSSRTQSIAQVVGLALIVSVFIFVTYQDIMR
ncbi:hypothetical protein BH09PLA1_BH09PLA1_29310 [soil metagenome]